MNSQSGIVGLTFLISSCSIANLYFVNHYSTLLVIITIILINHFKKNNLHNQRKLFILCLIFTLCTTIISNKKYLNDNLIVSLCENRKKEFHFKVVNIGKELLNSENYLKGKIINSKPNFKYLNDKSILIKDNLGFKVLNKKELNICANCENIEITSDYILIKKAYLKNSKANKKNLLECLEFQLFDRDYGQSLAFGWAMLTGEKKFIDHSNIESYKKSGVVHYFAVSGLHIGFLFLILNFLLKRFFENNHVVLFFIFSFCLLYIYAINMPISAVRSLLMLSIFYFCRNSLLKCRRITFYCISLIIIIVFDPNSISSLGAQLSFNVVLFILFCFESNNPRKSQFPSFLDKAKSIFVISLAASTGSALLVFDVFQTFPYLSIFTNLIFAPFIFVFYVINVAHISFLCFFNSYIFEFLHEILYQFLNYISITVSNLTNFLPNSLSSNLDISSFIHYFLFTIFLLSFCYRISTKSRLTIVSTYYLSLWLSYYFLCN